MTEKNCVITVINGKKKDVVKEAGELSQETKNAADDFFERNGTALKNAFLTLPSK